jgi:hypothetical protein
MKKLLLTIGFVLIFATSLFATSAEVVTKYKYDPNFVEVRIAWTAHTDGVWTSHAFTAEEMDFVKGRWLCQIVTDPGTPAPDDDYDVYIYNANSADLLGGAGVNRDTANSEVAYPMVDATTYQRACVPVTDTLTVTISGIGADAAGHQGILRMIFR